MISALRAFVSFTKLHPILVNFTAALIPCSVAADLGGRWKKNQELRATAWWAMLVAGLVTPFTAITGWLFWMHDDQGVLGMTIHKWLGTSLGFLVVAMLLWRRRFRLRREWPSAGYLVVAVAIVLLLVVQGTLGGQQVFSGM